MTHNTSKIVYSFLRDSTKCEVWRAKFFNLGFQIFFRVSPTRNLRLHPQYSTFRRHHFTTTLSLFATALFLWVHPRPVLFKPFISTRLLDGTARRRRGSTWRHARAIGPSVQRDSCYLMDNRPCSPGPREQCARGVELLGRVTPDKQNPRGPRAAPVPSRIVANEHKWSK